MQLGWGADVQKLLPYFSFRGRANRQRYWLTSLAIYGLLMVSIMIGFMIPVVGMILVAVGFVAAAWAGLATAARRMHDRNKSAWWLLAMYLPMLLLSGLGEVASMSDPDAGVAFSALSLPFSIWILVELGCLKGTTGPNRFGEDPLNPAPVEVFA